jgi:uncharacterized damage-inducible protein DinB
MPGLVPPTAAEREALLSYLAQQRYVLRLAAYGLSDEQVRSTPTASALSMGGLIKHVAQVEGNWIDMVLQKPRGSQEDYLAGFLMGEDETLVKILERYSEAAQRTERVVEEIGDLDTEVPIPRGVPWFPQEYEAWSLRWVLLHLIEESARHAGHADIIRESLDGASAFSLMAAAEGWPETPWLKSWRPPGE